MNWRKFYRNAFDEHRTTPGNRGLHELTPYQSRVLYMKMSDVTGEVSGVDGRLAIQKYREGMRSKLLRVYKSQLSLRLSESLNVESQTRRVDG